MTVLCKLASGWASSSGGGSARAVGGDWVSGVDGSWASGLHREDEQCPSATLMASGEASEG